MSKLIHDFGSFAVIDSGKADFKYISVGMKKSPAGYQQYTVIGVHSKFVDGWDAAYCYEQTKFIDLTSDRVWHYL